ncbi:MAG: hydroxyacid dehydrogenase, partial [Anaerolineales bacterium]
MYRILITEDIGPAGLALLDDAEDAEYQIIHLPKKEQLIEIIGGYDAIITRSGTAMDAEIFAAATRLKIAARAGVGLDNIDVEAATLHGIQVMNTPASNTLGATELTMALMLSLCRNLPTANDSVKNGEWTRKAFMGTELNGKTLGVIGLGRIGSRVATRSQAFGMNVIAYDPYIAEEIAERIHVEIVGEFDELLSRADIITIHTPLTNETRGMIAAPEIARMKDSVRIINAARGGIIEEQALFDGLTSGKIAGAALDVYSTEPPNT